MASRLDATHYDDAHLDEEEEEEEDDDESFSVCVCHTLHGLRASLASFALHDYITSIRLGVWGVLFLFHSTKGTEY